MYIVTRLLPGCIGAIVVAGIEIALRYPARYISFMSVTFVLVLLVEALLLRKSSSVERRLLLAPPFVFFLGVAFALFFLYPAWLRHSVVVLAGSGIAIYAEEVYRYCFEPERYHQHSIEHLSSFLSIAAMALCMSGIFALRIYIDVRLIYLLPLTLVIAMLVSTSAFVTQSLSTSSLWSTVVIFSLLITEMAWAVNFLPTNYFVNSLIVTVPFYVALNIVRHELSNTLNSTIIRRYSLSGIVALCILIVTSQWFI